MNTVDPIRVMCACGNPTCNGVLVFFPEGKTSVRVHVAPHGSTDGIVYVDANGAERIEKFMREVRATV